MINNSKFNTLKYTFVIIVKLKIIVFFKKKKKCDNYFENIENIENTFFLYSNK